MRFTRKTLRLAMRTFLQACFGYVVVQMPMIDFTSSKEVLKHALISLAVSAVSAGLAAVMNLEGKNGDS